MICSQYLDLPFLKTASYFLEKWETQGAQASMEYDKPFQQFTQPRVW
jgi:hypothetical protein